MAKRGKHGKGSLPEVKVDCPFCGRIQKAFKTEGIAFGRRVSYLVCKTCHGQYEEDIFAPEEDVA